MAAIGGPRSDRTGRVTPRGILVVDDDLSAHSQARLNYIARELNERPRMTLGYQLPAERFQACVASTG